MNKKSKIMQEKGLIGKVIGGGAALLVALGILPANYEQAIGEGNIEAIATVIAFVFGILAGKDLELNSIAKQLGMDKIAVKKHVRSKTFKNAVSKMIVVVFSITTVTLL